MCLNSTVCRCCCMRFKIIYFPPTNLSHIHCVCSLASPNSNRTQLSTPHVVTDNNNNKLIAKHVMVENARNKMRGENFHSRSSSVVAWKIQIYCVNMEGFSFILSRLLAALYVVNIFLFFVACISTGSLFVCLLSFDNFSTPHISTQSAHNGDLLPRQFTVAGSSGNTT